MKTANFLKSVPFWSIVTSLLLNVIPSIQTIRQQKLNAIDSMLLVALSVTSAAATVVGITSGTAYYTPKGVIGVNKSDIINIVTDEHGKPLEDGNF